MSVNDIARCPDRFSDIVYQTITLGEPRGLWVNSGKFVGILEVIRSKVRIS
jgi:hypothetical protein